MPGPKETNEGQTKDAGRRTHDGEGAGASFVRRDGSTSRVGKGLGVGKLHVGPAEDAGPANNKSGPAQKPAKDASPFSQSDPETAPAGEAPSSSKRHGTALALSGGGFRAAMFHLGSLRRLNELGILSQVEAISSVSGGSIVAAHLASRIPKWPEAGSVVPEWEEHVAAPFRTLCRQNIRTSPLLKRLLPWNWFHTPTAIEALAEIYEQRLTGMSLTDLPAHPRYIICATDMTFGVNWVFDSAPTGDKPPHMGDYLAGYTKFPDWPLARAVAASSCFPPVFDPLPVGLTAKDLTGGSHRGVNRDQLVEGIRLSDGGLYDNLALEPIWKRHLNVLVSDGGGVFEHATDQGLLWRWQRYTDIVERQTRALRKRWLIAGYGPAADGTTAFWGINSNKRDTDPGPSYPEELVVDCIAPIRTDLDAFSEVEIGVLENHGYLVTDAAIHARISSLITVEAPLEVPHPDLMDEALVRQALAASDRRTLLGRR